MSTHITSHCFRLGLAALLLLTASTASAQWPQGLGGDRNDEVTVVKTAPGGDLFVAGHFSGSIETASGTVSTVGLQDVFVARFGPGGQLKWLRGAGGEGVDTVNDLVLDGGQNVYIVGEFNGTARMGGINLNSAGREDGYVAKLDANGDWKWAKSISGSGTDTARGIVFVEGDMGQIPSVPDTLVLVGSYHCAASLTGIPSLANHAGNCFEKSSDIYAAKITTAGQWQWAIDRGNTATGIEFAQQISQDAQGRIYIGGSLSSGGGAQVLRNDNFNSLGGWSSSDGSRGGILDSTGIRSVGYTATFGGITQNGVANYEYNFGVYGMNSPGGMLALRGGAVTLSSPSLSAANSSALSVEFKALRGFAQHFAADYYAAQCTYVNCTFYEGGQLSEKPDWGEDLRLQFYGSDGGWHNVSTFAGSGTEGQLYEKDGSDAVSISDPRAFHSGLRFRFSLSSASGSWTDSRVGDARSYDWWYVDDFKVTSYGAQIPYVMALSNAATGSPTLGVPTSLPDALKVNDMAVSPDGGSLLLTGERTGASGSNYCGMANNAGAFVASIDVSGTSIGACDWAKGVPGGVGRGITVGADGTTYFTGSFAGTLTFYGDGLPGNDGTLVSTQNGSGADTEDVFIGALSGSGTWQGGWVTGGGVIDPIDNIPAYAGGTGADAGMAIANSGGIVYVGGRFEAQARFGAVDSIVAVDDADAFLVNLGTDGRFFQEEHWTVGVPLTPPPTAKVDNYAFVPNFKVAGEDYDALANKIFLWAPPVNGADAKLIPLQPSGRVEVYWRVQGQPLESSQRTAPSIGSNRWPTEACSDLNDVDCYQVHVAGTPVQVEPAGGNYKVLELLSPSSGSSGATYNNGRFNADHGGTSVLIYVNGPTLDQSSYPMALEVVRSLPYNSVPLFVDNVSVEIGQPITDAFHNEAGLTGYVINEVSYYDGAGTDAAYQRSTRSGAIIPVNRYSDSRAQEQGHELAVAWYHRKRKGVYWPEKAVRYDPHWPYDPERIIIASEQGGEVLGQTPLTTTAFPSARIYLQNDFNQPGFNPNDEHAFMAPSTTGSGVEAVFALRSDFGSAIANDSAASSDPYTLIKYFDNNANQWRFRVFKVEATGAGYENFRFSGVAGRTISPPYPVRLLPGCAESFVEGQVAGEAPPPPFFQDYKNQLWAKSDGSGSVYYYYPAQPGFFTDIDNNDVNDIEGTACQPWLPRLAAAEGGSDSPQNPIKVAYDITWPAEVPQLVSGETLLTPKRGLPDIVNQAAVEVIYDDQQASQANPEPSDTLAQLIAPLTSRAVYLDVVPETVATDFNTDGTHAILGSADGLIKLPVSVADRIVYNPNSKQLQLGGKFDESGAGEPFLLLNVLSKRDRVVLKKLDGGDGHAEDDFTGNCATQDAGCTWDQAIEALFRQSRNPQDIQRICTSSEVNAAERTRICNATRDVTPDDVLVGYQDSNDDGILEPFQAVGESAALSAGLSQGNGYMTIAFNNDPTLNPLPVSLEVIWVGCLVSPPPPETATLIKPYQGQINVLSPQNIFDEQLVLRHSGDFGGNPDALEFEWYFHPDIDGTPPMPAPDPENGQLNGWIQVPLADPQGAVEVSIEGANIQTLSDNWYLARYRGLPACGNQTQWGLWAGQPGATPTNPRAQLAQGWVKRVLSRLNPFEARVQDFHSSPTNTYAGMLVQLGERYSGPIALNNDPDNINSIGLIEAYTTVMRRALQLSVDSTPPVDYGPANNAILLVASRLVDFYTLLGNEAYADAQDPTIGITTDSGSFTLNPSIFNFQNQLDSLLSEELVLLRGRDDSNGPVAAAPVYNRLFWNFTTGDGEVAYALSYNITDQNSDGIIDEYDARILFPQGHGDAWGHYLTATTIYYDLLRHPFFSWVPRPEAVTVAGVPIQVDFLDERQFAETAAAKARTGAEIVDLTYRYNYVQDPEGQYQGYEDTNPERAWGMSEWGRRAGMGAYFDWATVNAILPAEDPNPNHEGIQKIQRSTVESLDEIAANFGAIQGQVDEADAGLNPLGLAKDVVAFDIDPTQLDRFNKTQFEQIYDRALKALENVNQIWLFANELNNQLRRTQDNADNMFEAGREEELGYANDLIEIFGYPYDDDIGPGGTYPDGYDGPDMYHYMYIDVPTLAGTAFDFDGGITDESDLGINRIETFTGTFQPSPNGVEFFNMHPLDHNDTACLSQPDQTGCPLGTLDLHNTLDVQYTTIQSPDFGFWFTKPDSWTGSRRAPGELQQILQQMLQARISLKQALVDYDKLRLEILAQADTLKATFDVSDNNINIAIAQRRKLQNLTIATEVMNSSAIAARRVGEFLDTTFKGAVDCIPKNLIAGLAAGGDVASTARCAVTQAANVPKFALDTVADALEIAGSATDAAKEDVGELSGIQTSINEAGLELYNVKGELDALMREEPVLRAEVFARTESIKELVGDYKAALSRGQRIFQNLVIFRQEGAAGTQQYRYQDMAFRIFRNDALQKYRQSFNLAARYVYLAASAYDYETNLLGSDSQAGQKFLTDVVKERSVGQVFNGEPVSGSPGLANVMAQMKLNFDVLKGQMGFNNPQVETNRFSLRKELFRIPDGAEGDAEWQAKLESMRVDDLWRVPEFRRYARPFAPESAGPQPGLVIEFSTNVTFGLNFFGWDLGPQDSSYDSSQFATRIRSVGAWFGDYADLPLADDPRIYVIPVGEDVLRAPSADDFSVRQWQVVDQAIPTPFPIGSDDLDDFGWNPLKDTLSGSQTDLRRYGRIRAFHFSEPFDDSQVTSDSRLIGRSVWNRKWMVIIPGGTFLNDPVSGLDTFIHGPLVPGGGGVRDGHGVSDIRIFFKTYAYSGL